MKRFVIGDIHGGCKALLQCLERAQFNPAQDLLISLGDICDGWPEVKQTIDELLKIKNLKVILGNHDQWTLRWMQKGTRDRIWTSQGGLATMESYANDPFRVPETHKKLLESAMLYLELDQKLFVHGGILPDVAIERQDEETLLWDRNLVCEAYILHQKKPEYRFGPWQDIFVGHTTTEVYQTLEPIHACNVWVLDTGGGWSGKLTIMNIDTHEYWQSDLVPGLYPGEPGRRGIRE